MESAKTTDRTWLVAAAAAMWGTSALMREPLAAQMPASTIVFFEHLVIVLCLLPWMVPAVRAVGAASPKVKVSVLLIGGGSSAVATMLFTQAFAVGSDPITPQVLQKLQPLFAILLAALFLGERVKRRFPLFAVPALVGAWLLAFPSPLSVGVGSAYAALLAVGAAALWAAGTVFGRLAGSELKPSHVTALRFGIGLVAAGVIVWAQGAPFAFEPFLAGNGSNLAYLVVLALIPGLVALLLYYRGLSSTPASRATLAELAFPLTAAAVGVVVLQATLTWSQWTGFALVLLSITALGWYEKSGRTPTVTTPDREIARIPAT